MASLFTDLSEPDPLVVYDCRPLHIRCSGWSHLMKLVLMVNDYPEVMSMIQSLLKNIDKVEINRKIGGKITVLMMACTTSNTHSNNTVVKMLIDAGADTDVQSDIGRTALMMSCEDIGEKTMDQNGLFNSNIETARILIDAGANVNIQNETGSTALMIAITWYNYDIEIIKLLIDSKTDLDLQSFCDGTALIMACEQADINGFTDIANILIDRGANVTLKNSFGRTALMILFMVQVNNSNLIEKLIHLSKQTLLDVDTEDCTAYDYYIKYQNNFLDDYHLKLLKGDISVNNTKSARN